MDRKYILTAFGYGIVGLILGIYMAVSHNHGQLVTHAHIMLLGFVVSFVYGVCYKIFLPSLTKKINNIQYYLHQAGTLILVISLFCLYGRFLPESVLGPVLGMSSLLVLVSMVLMKVLFIRSK